MIKLQRFKNRRQAGALLAQRLGMYGGRDDVLILALPRGGVPVGVMIARQLDVALDVLIVRKLGMPSQPEVALGAIASGGLRLLRPDLMKLTGVSMDAINAIAERESLEVTRRETLYRAGRPDLSLHDRTVILVDDGVATGATMLAAVHVVREAGPARLIIAVPVAPAETIQMLRPEVDELICLRTPEPFHAVGIWYDRFQQVGDDEVARLLERADRAGGRRLGSLPATLDRLPNQRHQG